MTDDVATYIASLTPHKQRHHHRTDYVAVLVQLYFVCKRRRQRLGEAARERCDRLLGLSDLAAIIGRHDGGVFFGFGGKLLRLVLSIASRLPYKTPWSILLARCDALSNGSFSQDVHTLCKHPFGMLLVAKHKPCGYSSFLGPRFFMSNIKAAGLQWLRKRTGIEPRWMALDDDKIVHRLTRHKKIDRLMRFL